MPLAQTMAADKVTLICAEHCSIESIIELLELLARCSLATCRDWCVHIQSQAVFLTWRAKRDMSKTRENDGLCLSTHRGE